MGNPREVSDERAHELMDEGVWMTSGGYKHRNIPKGAGQYLAWGEYPSSIRGCKRHTLEEIKEKGPWKIARPEDLDNTTEDWDTRFKNGMGV